MIITRKTVETARREGVPFAVKMTGGREYLLTSPQNVHVGAQHITLIDGEALPHVFSYLTITGINYLQPKR